MDGNGGAWCFAKNSKCTGNISKPSYGMRTHSFSRFFEHQGNEIVSINVIEKKKAQRKSRCQKKKNTTKKTTIVHSTKKKGERERLAIKSHNSNNQSVCKCT